MSITYLENACPEDLRGRDRTVAPALTPAGAARVRIACPNEGVSVDYFPNAARDMATALNKHAAEAEAMAEAERKRKAKPHPRAELIGPADKQQYWIWCNDSGVFQYSWPGNTIGHTSFRPGNDFAHTSIEAFVASPENIARWIRMARAAGSAAAGVNSRGEF